MNSAYMQNKQRKPNKESKANGTTKLIESQDKLISNPYHHQISLYPSHQLKEVDREYGTQELKVRNTNLV